jgi:hypothetical protein
MIVRPDKEYTLTDVMKWFEESKANQEVLIIDPCNPLDAKSLQARITIKSIDDIAVLTQWLGGMNK